MVISAVLSGWLYFFHLLGSIELWPLFNEIPGDRRAWNMAHVASVLLAMGAWRGYRSFADPIVHESDATIALVDRLDRPGGHWNHAYPFVRLHQPSAYYGLNSRPLGENRLDASGRNAGMTELAGAHELLAYFDTVLRRDFLPCGRVSWYPQCTYLGDSSFRSAVTGETRHVKAGKVVDATYMNVQVPKVRPPGFEVAEGVTCVPPNGLATIRQAYRGFVVVGAGKTAIDCTADGLEKRPTRPIFRDGKITLQTVSPCQQLFAAAMIDHFECAYADEAQKNALCVPVPHPDVTDDYLHMTRDIMRAQMAWAADPRLFQWLVGSRLDNLTTPGFRALLEGNGSVPPEQIIDTMRRAIENLRRFVESG